MKSLKTPFFLHVILFCCLGLWFTIGLGSCKAFQPSPIIHHEYVTHYVDSVITKDSICYIPVERYVDVANKLDTLHLATTLAAASAYFDTTSNMLKGEIHNIKGIQYQYITNTETIYKDSLVNVEVPVYVEHTEYIKRPLNTFSITLNIILISLVVLCAVLWWYKKKYSLFK